jgi:hypothetical protein
MIHISIPTPLVSSRGFAYVLDMTQVDAQRLGTTRRKNTRYTPRQFNALTRGRFIKARRLRHLARVQGQPTDAQIEMAHSAAVLEWGALVGENEGTLGSLREAREHRRLLLQVLASLDKSIAAPEKSRVSNHLSDLHSRYGTPR